MRYWGAGVSQGKGAARRRANTLALLATLAAGWIAGGCKVVRTSSSASTAGAALDPGVTTAPVPVSTVLFRVPTDSEITNPRLLASIRRGRALAKYTRDSLPEYVGNALQCVSCHPNDATRANAMPWVGVYARFPQYRSRAGNIILIEDRINDCFRRSMHGKALPVAGRDMRDLVAYMAFLSNGYPVGAAVEGQGIPAVDSIPGDTARAKPLFRAKCAACHGPSGQGTEVAPPLWGPRSFNIGAGMARRWTAAAFIKEVMPQNAPRTLSDQEANDLAALITSRPRPDFPGKELDWPKGDPPKDVAYQTRAAQRLARQTLDKKSSPR